jgi:hypothetical protein
MTDTSVTSLLERRSRDESAAQARLRTAVEAARTAAADAFFETLGATPATGQELRLMIAATRGDPTAEHAQTEAVFFALDDQLPVQADHKKAMALATLKAVSPEMYERVLEGLAVAEVFERLEDAADQGDAAAAEKLRLLTEPAQDTNN